MGARINVRAATIVIRTPELISDGTVFPIAWNMLDATKISPDAGEAHDTMHEVFGSNPDHVRIVREDASPSTPARSGRRSVKAAM